MMQPLSPLQQFSGRRPLVLCVMDGIGYGKNADADAVQAARTPNLDWLHHAALATRLKAHGPAVGLPDEGDMGNSEVGHNAIGAGRVFAQGAKLVNKAIASGKVFEEETWQQQVDRVKTNDGTLHFIGLFSDGNVHSHLDHLRAMIDRAHNDGVQRVRVHTLLDGRDVGETSALDYIDPFEDFLAQHNAAGVDYRIASGGGRMYITMDRYGANWDMVERGWNTHVHGQGRQFASAHEAIETYRDELGCIDQDMPEFVIAEDGQPVGPIGDGDAVICFNFRGDRALELSAAFDSGDEFDKFDRGARPDVLYAGMMEYDSDLGAPKHYLVTPPVMENTLGEYLAATGLKSLALSETQKFGHVTYFFNGNRSGKFDDDREDYEEIRSDVVPFEQRPWMKSAEITDRACEAITGGGYDFVRFNFPNGDMVGHTGVFDAAVIAVEALDLALGRLIKAVQKAGATFVVTADHGNSDEMFELDKKTGAIKTDADGKPKAKTSHTLNPVPFLIWDPSGKGEYKLSDVDAPGLSNIAATCCHLLGLQPPEHYDPSLITFD